MRRDHFTVTAENTAPESDAIPTLTISYSGPAGTLTAHLQSATGELPDGDDVDAAFRLQEPADAEDATGVFGLSRRLTGDFVLEANGDAEAVLALVDAARRDDGTDYRIHIERTGATDVVVEKETLLVYDDEGSLLRPRSLIPSGVEL
jgi:hypothetical protein